MGKCHKSVAKWLCDNECDKPNRYLPTVSARDAVSLTQSHSVRYTRKQCHR